MLIGGRSERDTMNHSKRREQMPVDTASVDDVPPEAWERDLSLGPVFERIRSQPRAQAHYEAVRAQLERTSTART